MHKTVIIVVIAIAAVLFFLLGYLPALSWEGSLDVRVVQTDYRA